MKGLSVHKLLSVRPELKKDAAKGDYYSLQLCQLLLLDNAILQRRIVGFERNCLALSEKVDAQEKVIDVMKKKALEVKL